MGSLTHLRIGKERIPAKPPRSVPPCTEPYVTGTNILRDPGFELHIANTGGGPVGDEIPDDGDIFGWPGMTWTDNTLAPSNSGWLANLNNYPADDRWYISTANPRSGTYHARYEQYSYNNALWPIGLIACVTPTASTFIPQGCRIDPGDYIKFTVYAEVDSVGSAPEIKLFCDFYDATTTSIVASFALKTVSLTTSYAAYFIDGFAPAGSVFALPGCALASGTPTYFDVDDCALEVS